MRKYSSKPMEGLAKELTAGLVRLRKGYVDAAEELAGILDEDRRYPYEFVVYRLTGYRPQGPEALEHSFRGRTLRADLLRLMLDLCDSFALRTSDYAEPVYDTSALAKRFSVSTKTIQRWRRRGLPARRLIFPDGRRRIAFLDGSVRRFVQRHHEQVERGRSFSLMGDEERDEIIARARRMVRSTDCSLSDVAHRLADRTGRAAETIRYTIRRHDRENSEQAVFPAHVGPLADEEKSLIYRAFLAGTPVPSLADRYRRTRGSVYRIIKEMRARQLVDRPIQYVPSPEFEEADAEDSILHERDAGKRGRGGNGRKPPPELPLYLQSLYEVPLLEPEQERNLFRKYNFLKYQADELRKKVDVNNVRTSQLKQIESLLLQANLVKNRIVRANLRLVVSIAKKHLGGVQTLFELISDGNVSLMRAVERFDYMRGFRFSTYASWAIMRNFARSVPRERYQVDRYTADNDEVLDIAASLRSYDPNEINLDELRESIDAMLSHLSPRERTILIDHYGLNEPQESKTFEQLGEQFGVSKERVRQIELEALQKLRKLRASVDLRD